MLKSSRRGFMKWAGAIALTIAIDPKFGAEWAAPVPKVVRGIPAQRVHYDEITKFQFPIVRRVFPNLIYNEIVSVQPMTAPVGAVFFLDYQYMAKSKPWWKRIFSRAA